MDCRGIFLLVFSSLIFIVGPVPLPISVNAQAITPVTLANEAVCKNAKYMITHANHTIVPCLNQKKVIDISRSSESYRILTIDGSCSAPLAVSGPTSSGSYFTACGSSVNQLVPAGAQSLSYQSMTWATLDDFGYLQGPSYMYSIVAVSDELIFFGVSGFGIYKKSSATGGQTRINSYCLQPWKLLFQRVNGVDYLYAACVDRGLIRITDPAGAATSLKFAGITDSADIQLSSNGNLYGSDSGNYTIFEILSPHSAASPSASRLISDPMCRLPTVVNRLSNGNYAVLCISSSASYRVITINGSFTDGTIAGVISSNYCPRAYDLSVITNSPNDVVVISCGNGVFATANLPADPSSRDTSSALKNDFNLNLFFVHGCLAVFTLLFTLFI